jgi:thiamine-monophosphate kinase
MTERELLASFGRMFDRCEGLHAPRSRNDNVSSALASRGSGKGGVVNGVVTGVGDDAAIVRPRAGEDLLLTTDSLVEGRHFHRDWFSGRELGWRLAAVNLSDIAAMGGKPLYALVSLCIPKGVSSDYVLDIQRGVRDHLKRFSATVIGGNVSGITKTLVCDLTLVGSVRRGKQWPRAGRAGDAIVLVGHLGEARAGLEILQASRSPKSGRSPRLNRSSQSNRRPHAAHSSPWAGRLVRAYKKPRPLLEVAHDLRNSRAVHGAIDVSDGFALDVIRMCEGASSGCELHHADFPVSKNLTLFCGSTESAIDYALNGGDDYALILSVAWGQAARLAARIRRRHRVPATVVGQFTRHRGRYQVISDTDRRRALEPTGWDHLGGR